MEPEPRTFGEALTALMRAHGISENTVLRDRMAEQGLKVNDQTIGYHRNDVLGSRGPQTETLRRYCLFFKVAPDYFAPFLAHLTRPAPPARSSVRSRPEDSLQLDNAVVEQLKRTTLLAEILKVPLSEHELSILFFVRRAAHDFGPPAIAYIERTVMQVAMDGPPKSQLRSGGDRGE